VAGVVNPADRLSQFIGILCVGNWLDLIDILLLAQVRSLASNIRQRGHGAPDQCLKIKVPVLHIRPNRLIGYRDKAQRELRRLTSQGDTDILVATNVGLCDRLNQRRRLLGS